MTDPDGIEPGQTWASRHQRRDTVRITVVEPDRIGFTSDRGSTVVRYLRRRKFTTGYQYTRRSQ